MVNRKEKDSARRDDPGEFTVTLARQGFVPGDTIDVYVQGTDEVLSALARNEGIVKLKRVRPAQTFRDSGDGAHGDSVGGGGILWGSDGNRAGILA